MVKGEGLMVNGEWLFMIHGSWFTVNGSPSMERRKRRAKGEQMVKGGIATI